MEPKLGHGAVWPRTSLPHPPRARPHTSDADAPSNHRHWREAGVEGESVRPPPDAVHPNATVLSLAFPAPPRRHSPDNRRHHAAATGETPTTATYVLLHGAYQGGWIWQYVTPHLRAACRSCCRRMG